MAMELLAPAGNEESLRAAIFNGAGSIYLGGPNFNARQYATNFSEEELERAVAFCHLYGVKLYLTMNTLVTDREEKEFLKLASFANNIGIDGVIVQDLGMATLLHKCYPKMAIHASTQMSIHNSQGAQIMAKHGISRAVLARELSLEEIRKICKESPIEIEVFGHGALCMSYSGQCYFSGQIGERSGNRGRCAQVCRLPYGYGKKGQEHPLSLKDLCTAAYLQELEEMGVAALKIEGRMKRPEYVALVTSIYQKLLKTKRAPSPSDYKKLELIFSRQGFTQGYLTKNLGEEMFGMRQERKEELENKAYLDLLKEARQTYQAGNPPSLIRLDVTCSLEEGKPAFLKVMDDENHVASCFGSVVERANNQPLSFAKVKQQLEKTGGTPFFIRSITADVGEGISLPLSALNEMRRNCLASIEKQRTEKQAREEHEAKKLLEAPVLKEMPAFSIEARSLAQITQRMLNASPSRIYLPLSYLADETKNISPAQEKTELCAIMPRVVGEDQWEKIFSQLRKIKERNIYSVLCGNIGQIETLKQMGFTIYGDYGLNVFNSRSVATLKEMGLSGFTASFEMSLPQIRDLKKYMPAEIIIYGHLPLMLLKNRPKGYNPEQKSRLVDRKGEEFILLPEQNEQWELLNAYPLYVSDKLYDFTKVGASSLRFKFSDEDNVTAERIFMKTITADLPKPKKFTRGLYYKGVE